MALAERDVFDLQLIDSLRNRMQNVPVDEKVGEVVKTFPGSPRMLDVCRVRAWTLQR